MVNIEKNRKLSTIVVDESKMIKWKITDKCDNLQYISDPVDIDSYKFVFYAERNSKWYCPSFKFDISNAHIDTSSL